MSGVQTRQDRFVDLARDDVTPAQAQLLDAHAPDWFSSTAPALYLGIPAERLVLSLKGDGDCDGGFWYRAVRSWSGVNELHIAGADAAAVLPALRWTIRASAAGRVTLGPASIAQLAALRRLPYPLRIQSSVGDSVIDLPDSVDAYLETLGRKTRRNLPYYVRRLRREWEDLRVCFTMREEIAPETYFQLVRLGQARVAAKGAVHALTAPAAQQRVKLARRTGMLGGIYHEERLRAGTLTALHGDEAHLLDIAHDPAYDRLNAGNACLFFTVERLIALGVRRLHLLSRSQFYKQQFGGKLETRYHVILFPQRRALLEWYAARAMSLLREALPASLKRPIRRARERLKAASLP